MKMNLINLTPHAIRILDADGATEILSLPPSGAVARVGVTRRQTATIAGVPVYVGTYGAVSGLPAPADGTMYVVSAMVRQAVPGRRDVLSPGELVRDSAGQPIGCRGLEGNA